MWHSVPTCPRDLCHSHLLACTFVDVEDLEGAGGIGKLEEIVEHQCGALLVVITDGYFRSKNCLREMCAALHADKRLILVHEIDPLHGGLSREELLSQCPLDCRPLGQNQTVGILLRERVSQSPTVAWQRIEPFQLVSLRLVSEALLQQPLFIATDLSHQSYTLSSSPYASPHNNGAQELLDELVEEARAPGESDRPASFLLLLNGRVFDDPQLVDEVITAMDTGQPIVMVHDVRVPFADIIARTPQRLAAQPPDGCGLYNAIAVALLEGPHRAVSLRLIALKLDPGAQLRSGPSWTERCCAFSHAAVKRLTTSFKRKWRRRTSDVIAPENVINADPLLAQPPIT